MSSCRASSPHDEPSNRAALADQTCRVVSAGTSSSTLYLGAVGVYVNMLRLDDTAVAGRPSGRSHRRRGRKECSVLRPSLCNAPDPLSPFPIGGGRGRSDKKMFGQSARQPWRHSSKHFTTP